MNGKCVRSATTPAFQAQKIPSLNSCSLMLMSGIDHTGKLFLHVFL